MTHQHSWAIFIGRFQPIHNAHLKSIIYGLEMAKTLIIVLGSASSSRTIKNPWSAEERREMILSSLTPDQRNRVQFVFANDYLYNDNLWISNIQQKIDQITDGSDDIALVGYSKDKSSFYLNLFPQWKFIGIGDAFDSTIDATKIRDLYFKCDLVGIQKNLPPSVFEKLKQDMMSTMITPNPEFMSLKSEFEHIVSYRDLWKGAPFPPTFVTVDTVVIQSGHVLVVRRKCQPGKGLMALPGGFLNQGERIVKGAIRELKEETGIALSAEELEGAIIDQKVFDHPDRSLRGRTITHAFCLNLGTGKLPRVKGQDDAEKAFWLSLREVSLKEKEFFEDHFHMINFFVSKF